jgi:hypothetical protein
MFQSLFCSFAAKLNRDTTEHQPFLCCHLVCVAAILFVLRVKPIPWPDVVSCYALDGKLQKALDSCVEVRAY